MSMMEILLTTGAKMSPIGLILIVGFVILIIYLAIYDKKNAKRFDEEFERKFQDKKACGNDKIFITKERELIVREVVNGASGYQAFQLDDAKYLMSTWDFTTKMWQIALYDINKKLIKGEGYHSGKKRGRQVTALFRFRVEDVELVGMLVEFIPDISLVGLGFKEYKGSYKKQ